MAACFKTKAAAREGRDSGFNEAQGLAACETQYSAAIIDLQSRSGVEQYRRRWVRRRIHVGPELSAYLADMAFQSKGLRND